MIGLHRYHLQPPDEGPDAVCGDCEFECSGDEAWHQHDGICPVCGAVLVADDKNPGATRRPITRGKPNE
jgi:hypothetical protein